MKEKTRRCGYEIATFPPLGGASRAGVYTPALRLARAEARTHFRSVARGAKLTKGNDI